MSNNNRRHVVPNQNGGWDVCAPGAQRSSAHTDTQAEAVRRAGEIVGNADVPPSLWSPHDGVSVNTTGYRFFAGDPDVGQRLWYTLTLLPSALLFGGALLLAYRLIRGAERDGIFTVATAARLRTLGWFLLIGGLAKMVVETVATNRLLTTMVVSEVGWMRPGFWSIPWTVLVTAAGLLTFARIMRIGAEMRKDLEGTV